MLAKLCCFLLVPFYVCHGSFNAQKVKTEDIHKFSYLVGITQRLEKDNDVCSVNRSLVTYVCAGAVLSPTWVISAAQCYHTEKQRLRLQVETGTLLLSDIDEYMQCSEVEKVRFHPTYRPNKPEGPKTQICISLLKLATPIALHDLIRPVFLPERKQKFQGSALLTGWHGEDREEGPRVYKLQYSNLTSFNIEKCLVFFKRQGKASKKYSRLDICAKPNEPNTILTTVNLGAPLVHGDRLVGLLTFAVDESVSGRLATFNMVAYFGAFIRKHVTDINLFNVEICEPLYGRHN